MKFNWENVWPWIASSLTFFVLYALGEAASIFAITMDAGEEQRSLYSMYLLGVILGMVAFYFGFHRPRMTHCNKLIKNYTDLAEETIKLLKGDNRN